MRSTKFWVILIGLVLAVSVAVSAVLLHSRTGGSVASVYQDGVCIKTIDLSAVDEPYSFTVTWKDGGYNTVSVERGRICVSAADCPDQICVRQGWISNRVAPVACLPHRLIIELADPAGEDPDVDAVTG